MVSIAATTGALSKKCGFRLIPVYGIVSGKCECWRAQSGKGSEECLVEKPGKHPRIKAWQTVELEAGDVWWEKQWPNANVGILTGKRSWIWVLDIDPKNGGFETMDRLTQQHGYLPRTFTVRTGSGGLHYYFKYNPEIEKNRAGFLPGLDVRSDGGYVVAPPSTHISGNSYKWENLHCGVAEAPRWLVDLVTGRAEALQPPAPLTTTTAEMPADTATTTEVICDGTRNDNLFRVGCGLRGSGADESQIEEQLQAMNEQQCNPPLESSEVKMVAHSAAKYEPNARKAATDIDSSRRYNWFMPLNTDLWFSEPAYRVLSLKQAGALVRLLMTAWRAGGRLENDPTLWAEMTGATARWFSQPEGAKVLDFFEPTEDEKYLIAPGMAEQQEENRKNIEQRRAAGKASAEARRQKERQLIPIEGSEPDSAQVQ